MGEVGRGQWVGEKSVSVLEYAERSMLCCRQNTDVLVT